MEVKVRALVLHEMNRTKEGLNGKTSFMYRLLHHFKLRARLQQRTLLSNCCRDFIVPWYGYLFLLFLLRLGY